MAVVVEEEWDEGTTVERVYPRHTSQAPGSMVLIVEEGREGAGEHKGSGGGSGVPSFEKQRNAEGLRPLEPLGSLGSGSLGSPGSLGTSLDERSAPPGTRQPVPWYTPGVPLSGAGGEGRAESGMPEPVSVHYGAPFAGAPLGGFPVYQGVSGAPLGASIGAPYNSTAIVSRGIYHSHSQLVHASRGYSPQGGVPGVDIVQGNSACRTSMERDTLEELESKALESVYRPASQEVVAARRAAMETQRRARSAREELERVQAMMEQARAEEEEASRMLEGALSYLPEEKRREMREAEERVKAKSRACLEAWQSHVALLRDLTQVSPLLFGDVETSRKRQMALEAALGKHQEYLENWEELGKIAANSLPAPEQ